MWLRAPQSASNSRESISGIVASSSNDCGICMPVYQIHVFDLLMFIVFITLDDAVPINPEITKLEFTNNFDGIFNDIWKPIR
jgi:hypothetical protein